MADDTDKRLFTPGPLTTSPTVKAAMLRDLGSRDDEFLTVVAGIRASLLRLAGVSVALGFEAVPVQGSGTYGVEATITTAVSADDGSLLVGSNGAYGDRLVRIAETAGIRVEAVRTSEDQRVEAAALERALERTPSLTHVAVVHCETSSGIVNDVDAIGAMCRRTGRCFIVDSMSGFGALPVDLEAAGIDFLVSSANKCMQGVPGFSFVLARRAVLAGCAGRSPSLSLDLHAQWRGLEDSGQFRFTPPTHAMLAFAQALRELDAEGGPEGRGRRYAANQRRLVAGMRALGLETVLPDALHGPVITTFRFPSDERFAFETFYRCLSERGFVIYPGKLSKLDCFRIGTAGHLFEADIDALLAAIADVLAEMGLESMGPS
ncbi:MAG: 2-aminoethylphosphonate--pyruvate transaminase [Myxococcales bacterium]|nr:MAG: 2-aminoethylphosphonate--pyruvate transaminase [Myxococcales bacterium]